MLLTTPNYAFHVHLDQEPLGKDQVDDPSDGQHGASLQVDPTGKTERKFRHADHQFEWTPGEFRRWAVGAARAHGYVAEIGGIGGSMDVRASASTYATIQQSNDTDLPRWDGGGSEGNSQGWRLPPPKDAPDAPPSEDDGSLLFALDEGTPDPEQEALDVSYATHVAVFWRIPSRPSSSRSRSSGTTSSHSRGRAVGHWGPHGRAPNASSPSTSAVPTHASRSPGSTTLGTDDRRGRSKIATPLHATAGAAATAATVAAEPEDGEPFDQSDGEEEEDDPDDGRRVRSREPARLTFLGDLLHSRSPVRKSTVHELVAHLHATPQLASRTPSDQAVLDAVQSFLTSTHGTSTTLQALWDDPTVRLASRARVDTLLHSLGLPLPAPLPQPRGWLQAQVATRRRSTPSVLSPGPTYVRTDQPSSSGVLATSADRLWSLTLEPNSSPSSTPLTDHVVLTYTPPSQLAS